MSDRIDFLKLKIITHMLRMDEKNCNVTNLAKHFGVEKYSVSRAIMSLEKEGLIDKSDTRHPKLSTSGVKMAQKYQNRMDIATNHLIYEGVSEVQACNDAAYISMYCSDETINVIKSTEERYRIKNVLKNKKEFSGELLSKHLRDGDYTLPFIIYRETVKNGSNISMANEAFKHPCVLSVRDGYGTVNLKAQRIVKYSPFLKKSINGKVEKLKYFDGDKFIEAEKNGKLISFPIGSVNFVNMGSEAGSIFYGSVCLKMACGSGVMYMPESTAIFTLLF
mgnify:FL=1